MRFNFDPPDDAAWTLFGSAAIRSDLGAHSAPNALYLFARTGPPGNAASVAQRTLTLTPGQPYPVRLYVSADPAPATTLHVILDDGVAAASFDLASSLGGGFQLWEPGAYTPAAASVVLTLAAGAPISTGSGSWLVDDFELDEGVDMAQLDKWAAIENAVAVLKGINGGSWHTDLGSRVFTRLFDPTDEPEQKLAYVCFPLVQEGERISYEGRAFTSTWTLRGWAYFEDNLDTDKRNSSGAVLAAKFRNDLIRAFMQNQHLGGQTVNTEVVSVNTEAGVIEGDFAEVVFEVEFQQIGAAADLAAA